MVVVVERTLVKLEKKHPVAVVVVLKGNRNGQFFRPRVENPAAVSQFFFYLLVRDWCVHFNFVYFPVEPWR